jgi:hypothetical protein
MKTESEVMSGGDKESVIPNARAAGGGICCCASFVSIEKQIPHPIKPGFGMTDS